MSSYTMQLRAYIEMFSQGTPNLSQRDRIEIGRKKLFDFTYPIFDEKYRIQFETNFIRYFYMTEIGFETEQLFKFHLETWLNINMPYFNKMYLSEELKYNPLYNAEMNVTHTKKNDTKQTAKQIGNATGTSNANATSSGTESGKSFERDIISDTPDSRLRLSSQDGSGVIEYASKIVEEAENHSVQSSNQSNSSQNNNMNSTVNQDNNVNELEDFIQHRVGKIGVQSYPEMIMKYRNSLLRVDQMIFDEVRNKLFMLVF